MTAAPQGAASAGAVPRRNPRFPTNVPVDFTVLRSGVPHDIPGRGLNLCEGGLAAVIAGELRCGDSVALQFRLPHVALPFQARAVIRHESRLHYGLEFVGLSPEQQTMIRYWAGTVVEAEREALPPNAPSPIPDGSVQKSRRRFWTARLRRGLWMFAVAGALIAAAGWWHWYHAWSELESELPVNLSEPDASLPQVPGTAMQVLVTHKVEPIYPAAAREVNLQGLVLVRAVVGEDGSVIAVHPLSGPDVLTQAAVEAVRWWRFQPYQVNGRPKEVETTLALEFHP